MDDERAESSRDAQKRSHAYKQSQHGGNSDTDEVS
jgi:hypothetical protein